MAIQAATRRVATFSGLGAILLWAVLALFTAGTGAIPPFQLTAMTFCIAFLAALLKWIMTGTDLRRLLKLPRAVWLLGVGGLFGYHFFYFLALKNAPPAEASLIAYLWPLLIILFSALLPGERFHWFHIAGGGLSLLGAGLLISKGEGFNFAAENLTGYAAAICCAFIWSSYSVLSRRFASVSSDAIGLFCGATALLALFCHLAFEETVLPATVSTWASVLALGFGPVGVAFFLWDKGMKHGDIQLLGVLSYLSPLLSTLILLSVGVAVFSWSLLAGCLLITGGAAVGSYPVFRAFSKAGKA
ncbi:MAG: EamA family transporter [Alphaproteobacteria bacterium]|nr:MAG: EamA family transporter [Alphaproteobacteria bacterium]